MKQFIKTILNKVMIIGTLLLFFNSCKTDDGTLSCVPITTVSVTINVNLPLYSNLNNPGGWVYVNGATAGTRGIIVVRTASGYKAYDRNAPHICPGEKTTLYVKNDISIVCEADNAEWILLTGQPTKVANRAPRTYQVIVNSNGTLLITN
jgi:nitrite reductase/ring-hydroxylating ferredoxin subunit